jgi:hypothetical protein
MCPAVRCMEQLTTGISGIPYRPEEVAIAVYYSSDHQKRNAGQEAAKKGFDEMTPELSKQLHQTYSNLHSETEVRAGDHIEGSEAPGAVRAFFGACAARFLCCCSHEPEKQAKQAIRDIAAFEAANPHIPVIAPIGNHDFYDKTYTMPRWCIERYGSLHFPYKPKYNDGSDTRLTLLCCAAWADDKGCDWLEKEITGLDTAPFSVVTHVDEQLGDNQAWLSNGLIQKLAAIFKKSPHQEPPAPAAELQQPAPAVGLQEYATAHTHDSYGLKWQPDGPSGRTYNTQCAGGNKKLVSLYRADGQFLDTLFYAAHKNPDGTYTPERVPPVVRTPEHPQPVSGDGFKRWWNSKVVAQWYDPKKSCCGGQ